MLTSILLATDSALENVLSYSPITVLNVILALIVVIGAVDKGIKWIREKAMDCHNELSDREDMEELVDSDHDKLKKLEDQVDAITQGIRVVLQTSLMNEHDMYMSRKPSPYVTKYERLMHIEMYQVYTTLNNNPLMEGFHKEIMDLPVRILTNDNEPTQ